MTDPALPQGRSAEHPGHAHVNRGIPAVFPTTILSRGASARHEAVERSAGRGGDWRGYRRCGLCHELALQGLDVLVVDRAGVGGGVTAAGMGHLVVMDDSPAEFVLSAYSRALWLALAPRLDARHAFVRCGTLWVAADDEECALAQDRQRALQQQGIVARHSTRGRCARPSPRCGTACAAA